MTNSNRSRHFFAVVVAVCAFAAVFVLSAREVQAAGIVTECTEAGLDRALEGGGDITFDCPGSAPHTILISSTKIISASVAMPTRIYGGGEIILDGQGTSGLFSIGYSGGYYVPGHLELDGVTLAHSSGSGIHIDLLGVVTVTHSVIISNAMHGISNGGRLVIRDSLVAYNSADYSAGAGILNGGWAYVENTTFIGNTSMGGSPMYPYCDRLACGGGGIYNGDTIVISNSSIISNVAFLGGGLRNHWNMTVVNSTISGNRSTYGPVNNVSGQILVINTIITDGDGRNCGSLLTGSNNISSDATCVISGTGNMTNTDPMLGALVYTGNWIPMYSLLPGSPAIDGGTNEGCPATDQRGFARPYGAACDIGAFVLASGLNEGAEPKQMAPCLTAQRQRAQPG